MILDLRMQTAGIDFLVLLTLLSVFMLLKRFLKHTPFQWLSWSLPLIAALNGIIWTYWPKLSAHRLDPPPLGQGLAILSLIAVLLLPLAFKKFRNLLAQTNFEPLASFSYWRIIYGALLIILGLQSALPGNFFWSAGVGDITAGIIAMILVGSKTKDSSPWFLTWNIVALADLIHVISLGAIFLRPFFIANPIIPPINMLPLAGVPMLIALHIFALVGLLKRQSRKVK
jgi:hypothetical protein